MKTINQSYTPAQRREIAQDLRAPAGNSFLEITNDYMSRVAPYGVRTFLEIHGFDQCEYPHGGAVGYFRECKNRLADELEAVK